MILFNPKIIVRSQGSAQTIESPRKFDKVLIINKVAMCFSNFSITIASTSFLRPTAVFRFKAIICVSLFFFYLPLPAKAWGPLGHQAICDMSWRSVHPVVQDELAQAAKRMGYRTFAQSCVWADHIRNDTRYRWASPLHYINVAKTANSVVGSACKRKHYKKPRCVLTAITYYHRRWLNTSLTRRERDEALLFFGHFMGDIHQPLHVSYANDRGGTRKMIVFNGKLMSFHSLWDTDILRCGTQASWRSLGKQLYRSSQFQRKNVSVSTILWANESLAITRHIYTDLEQYLPDDYCKQYHPIAVDRLVRAGVRLAALLEQGLSVLAYSEDDGDRGGRDGDSGEPSADKVQSASTFNEIIQ